MQDDKPQQPPPGGTARRPQITTRWVAFLLGHSFVRFSFVGGLGFLVDAAVLLLLYELADLGLPPARLASFAVAVTFTWWLNRRLTFQSRPARGLLGEWSHYVAVNGFGGVVNLLVFFLLTLQGSGLLAEPLPALAIASIAGLLFNYLGSRFLVFHGPRARTGKPPQAPGTDRH